MQSRREFLRGTAWMGAAAFAAGCTSPGFGLGEGGAMHGFRMKPMKRVRIGIVGLGSRGSWAMRRMSNVPGIDIVAICDKKNHKVDECAKWMKENSKPVPKEFRGVEAWKSLCETDGIDAVYVTTPWELHAPIGLRAMRNGKIAFIEVPAALTVDECWELVETSEKLKIPCMQLENCCYGEIEMLEFHVAKLGLLGELVHGEGAYIHDLRDMTNLKNGKADGECEWRYGENLEHKGNRYPTHGLVPLCLTFDINRGDRFDYLVSLESNQENFEFYKRHVLAAGDPRLKDHRVEMGDMNTTLIKTMRGRSILVQHDVSSPRPYTRLNFISGTKGAIGDYPFRAVFEKKPGSGAHAWYEEEELNAFREKYRHPIWKKIGDIAKKSGGHGGMDFIMDLRWAYCLQNGLPLDMDVYDLATTSCLCELTEKSVRSRSRTVDVPDFTRGGWRTAKPMEIIDVDMSKLDFSGMKSGDRPMTI